MQETTLNNSIKTLNLLKTTFLGVGLVFSPSHLVNAASNNINVWDDGFDTSTQVTNNVVMQNSENLSDANVFDANKSLETNFGVVENSSKTPLLSESTLIAMQQASQKYQQIINSGGWPQIGKGLKRGDKQPMVVKLRQRLFLVGDMPRVSGDAEVFDFNVDQAVRRFQARHGLVVNGIVSGDTLKELNVSATTRKRQIELNLNRIKGASAKLHNRSIVVNIPAMRVETVEDGSIVSRHNVIVGQPDRQTPVLSSTLSQVNFNPYWHVPVSIVRRDLVPKILTDPSYIKRTGMRIYTTWGGKEIDPAEIDFKSESALRYAYRQDPSRENSLGIVKLNFPNKHAVFMHDTPSKSLFARNYRAYSSGCVRIQNIRQIVDWVLKGDSKWSKADSAGAYISGERKDISIKNRVSVRMIYVTSWVTPAGTVHFRKDVYKRDGLGGVASVQ